MLGWSRTFVPRSPARSPPISNRHFEDKGADYARYRPTYPPALAAALAGLAPARTHAVDVGCGNGQLSVLLAEHFQHVSASDVSADQIANAAARPNISYNIGSAENIAAPDASAELICAAQAAHWFDLPSFYAEARRIAAPKAAIALITYGVFSADGPAAERIRQFYWNDIHKFWPEGRKHVEEGYAGFDFPFAPIAMPALKIKRDWTAADFLAYARTWSATKRAEKAGRGDILQKFETDLLGALGPKTRMKITWPISIRAGRL